VSQIVQVRELAQSPTSPPGSWPRCEVQFVYSDPNQPFLLYQGIDAQTILAYVKANEV